MLTEHIIREALRDCYDPEIPCNIVDLGLVYAIDLAPDPDAPGAGIPGVSTRYRVHIDLTLTTPQDPDTPTAIQLIAQIQNRLAAFENISRSEVTLVWQPAWTPDRISPEGQQRLVPQPPKQPQLVQIKSAQ
jgi:metal-sulfur cluster biosynthetic enzyme